VFHHPLFAVKVSVQALTVPEPTALRETEKAPATLEALASALADLSEPDLERLRAAKRQ
jgi:hypothetical protein